MNGAYLVASYFIQSFYSPALALPLCAFLPLPAAPADSPADIAHFCNFSHPTLYYSLPAEYLAQGSSYYLGQSEPNTCSPTPHDSSKTDIHVKLEEPSFLSAWHSFRQELSDLPPAPLPAASADSLEPKSSASKKGGKRAVSDRDYLPNKSEKKVSRRRSHENENRNVVPNEINQIVSFVQKRNKSGVLLEKIMRRYPPASASFTLPRFYLYQALLK